MRTANNPGTTARARGALAITLGLTVFASVATPVTVGSASAAATTKPNVLIILTDDQPKGMLEVEPTVRAEIANKGTTFSNAVVSTSLCCPSRVSMLTGLFANESGVFGNDAASQGGYQVFKDRGNEERTIATKLSKAGYVTGMFGKYINKYTVTDGQARPPGWNEFSVFSQGTSYYDYQYSADQDPGIPMADKLGAPLVSVPSGENYSTTQFGESTSDFIRRAPADSPLLAVYAPFASHAPFTAEPKYDMTGTVSTTLLKNPSYNEKDIKDKPRWVRKQKKQKAAAQLRKWRKQTETLRTVDDQVANILSALRETGRLDNTLIIYTSDNGYQHGQHRLEFKNTPYRASTNVDLLVKFPYQNYAKIDNHIVSANVDVATTVLATAGLPNTTSGFNLANPVATGVPMMGIRWRSGGGVRPTYCGWRTATGLFIRYGTKEEELYDYVKDPYELKNVAKSAKYQKMKRAYIRAATPRCGNLPPDYGPSFAAPNGKQPVDPLSSDE
ncbi:MAG: sulfatase [Actinomycetes bacterium]